MLECLARGFVGAWSDDLSAARHDLETITCRAEGFGGSLRSAAQWLLADVYYRLGAFDDAMVAAELARSVLYDTGRANSPKIAMACAVAAYTASAPHEATRPTREATSLLLREGRRSLHQSSSAPAPGAARWSLAVAPDDPQSMLEAAGAFEAAADAPELTSPVPVWAGHGRSPLAGRGASSRPLAGWLVTKPAPAR